MRVSQRTLTVLAAFVWYAGGIALLLKGSALIKNAYAIDAQSLWAPAALLLGVIAGLLKGKFLFSKSCKKNIQRIRSLANPHVAAGNYTYLCLVGALDLSISFALLTSSIVFLQLRAFQPLGTKAR